MTKKNFVVVMGSGFPKDKPVDEKGNEVLDVWGNKRLAMGLKSTMAHGSRATLVVTGGLSNEVTGKTVAEVSREIVVGRYLPEDRVCIAQNIREFEVSTRGDIQQLLSVLEPGEVGHITFVTEKPHIRRLIRIFNEECSMAKRKGVSMRGVVVEFLPSGAPAPWWYFVKENALEVLVRIFGEESVVLKLLWRAWDRCKPLLNMPRKPDLYNKK